MTIYIRHMKSGAVHSVADEHYNAVDPKGNPIDSNISVVADGERYPRPGIEVITEAQARKANPQLFGAFDPQIVFTAAELVAQHDYETKLAEWQGAHAANRAETGKKD